jgi:photosystem II stability/assembly factor-like uncharacterized protein
MKLFRSIPGPASGIRQSGLKWLFFSILFLISFSYPGMAQFREKYRGGVVSDDINGMFFLTPSTGFVAFSYNYIGFTQDSGKTYIQRPISYTNTDFNGFQRVGLTYGFTPKSVLAFSTDSLLAYGDYSFEPSILFSKDQGLTWKVVSHIPLNINAALTEGFTSLKMIGNTGFAVHHEGVMKTTDHGQTWFPVLNTPLGNLHSLSYPATGTIYVSGGAKIYRSTNDGLSWTELAPHPNGGNENYHNIFFTSVNTGYCSEAVQGLIYRTVDGGASWVRMNDLAVDPRDVNDLIFTNDSTGYIATSLYQVDKTTDYGKTWETCKKTPAYQYLSYSMLSLFFLNPTLGWAGADGEYLLITTDGGSATWPKAYFKTDTTGLTATGLVHLNNYSKKSYQYAWYKNDTLIGASYDLVYTHNIFQRLDTIKLVVNNGTDIDSNIQYIGFNPPVILSSFSPSYGSTGSVITINGINLDGTNFVSIGGVQAPVLRVSSTQVQVVISGNGASGPILTGSDWGVGKIDGFLYVAQPRVDLPLVITDSILCKSERASISIQQTESDVTYDIQDSLGHSVASGQGNGATLLLTTDSISDNENLTVVATRHGTITSSFPVQIHLIVEHPKTIFFADRINIATNEPVDYHGYADGAASYAWTFDQDASAASSTLQVPAPVYYGSAGQKTLTLISTTANGCADTASSNAVYVYSKPAKPESCWANDIEDPDTYYLSGNLNNMSPDGRGGFFLCGTANQPLFSSRYGITKTLPVTATFISRYTENGVLSWIDWVDNGSINASTIDDEGNIYITGICPSYSFMHFSTGDSILIYVAESEKDYLWSKPNGFIIKLDPDGKYLWHTILYDPSPNYQGYPVQGGIGTTIKIQGDRILVAGGFLANLSYVRNQQSTPLFTLPNSVYANDNFNDFLISIDKNGVLQWSSYLRFWATNQNYKITDAGFDANGDAYLSGYYEDHMLIHDAAGNEKMLDGFTGNNWGSKHGVVLKFDTQGKLLWNLHMDNDFLFHGISIAGMAVDPRGYAYVTGSISSMDSSTYVMMRNANGTSEAVSLSSYFVSKISPDGNHLWTRGSKYAYYGGGGAISLNGNDLYTAGTLRNNGEDSAKFSITTGGGAINQIPFYQSEMFLMKYDTAGNLKRLVHSGRNAAGYEYPSQLFVDSSQNVFIGGNVQYWKYGNGGFRLFGFTLGQADNDIFFAKLNPDFCTTDTMPIADAGADLSVCRGDSSVLGISAAGGSLSWSSRPAGFVSEDMHPKVAPDSSTVYYLTVMSAGGSVESDSVVVKVNTPMADAGKDALVCNGVPDTIGTKGVGDQYSWTSSPAGFFSSAPDPLVNPDTTTNYFLMVRNAQGCINFDTVLVRTGHVSVDAGIDTAICAGQAIRLGTVPDNNDVYNWTSNASGFHSAMANPLDTPVANNMYRVTAINNSGCIAVDSVFVTVKPVPATPVISENAAEELVSSATMGNQWYTVTREIITGDTSQLYKPTDDGWFTLQTEVDGCFSDYAANFHYTLQPVVISDSSFSIRVSPNPTPDVVVVKFSLTGISKLDYLVCDQDGRILQSGTNLSSGDAVNLSILRRGVYIIRFQHEGNKVGTVRVVRN